MTGFVTKQAKGQDPHDGSDSRLEKQADLRSAADALETPHDVMLRLVNTRLEIGVVQAGTDLGIFTALDASDVPLTAQDLAAPAKADPLLVYRLLRYLASIRMINETGKGLFGPSNSTRALADRNVQSALHWADHLGGPAMLGLGDFLRANKYQSQTGGHNSFQRAQQTNLPFYAFLEQYPNGVDWFSGMQSVPRGGDWLDVFEFAAQASKVPAGAPLFVDVGGSIGHMSARLLAKYSQVAGRIIVQDLPEAIATATPIRGIEFMSHNFFNEQPIKGAKFYYLRTILHAFDDDTSEKILRNLAPALSRDSVIVIDELALPMTGAHWMATFHDLNMYTMVGNKERTTEEWQALIERAGLKLVEIKPYQPVIGQSIIIAALK